MPRHPEVLTAIVNDSKEFKRCLHIVRETLKLPDGTELSQEQVAFEPADAKNQPKVYRQANGQREELQGEGCATALQTLRENKHGTETTLFAQADGQEISLSGASRSLALYQHTTTGELWIGKSDALQDDSLTSRAVLKERIANDIYAYYGVRVPRLAVAGLACNYHTADTQRIYGGEFGIRSSTHLLSRWLDRFTTYPHMPNFSAATDHYSLPIDDQLIAEKGLGRVLAVAHFIHDVDVINAGGKNVGYRLCTDEQGRLYAQTCKIDPGYAFYDVDNSSSTSTAHSVTQAMPFKTQHRATDYVEYKNFPRATQDEFIATIADIVDTPVADLEGFFRRQGAEALQRRSDPTKVPPDDFASKAINMLKIRQAKLAEVFATELAAYRATAKVEHKDAKEGKETKHTYALTEELQPIYSHHLLEASSPLFQQAQHFYIEPGTTANGGKEETPESLPTTLHHFLQDSEKQVLLLLGDSGFGKSTITQQITQQHWQSFLRAPQTSRIAIRIELKQFTARTVGQCVANVLIDDYHLSPTQITALKQRPCLILLDGFDESAERAKPNLWNTNRLSEWKDVKLIITCRPAYLEHGDIANCFYPAGQPRGMQQRYLAPFNPAQIEAYLTKAFEADAEDQLVATPLEAKSITTSSTQSSAVMETKAIISPTTSITSTPRESKTVTPKPVASSTTTHTSSTKTGTDKNLASARAKSLAEMPTLQELLQVPLMLKIFTDALPELQRQGQNLTQLNRYQLYEAFMQQWFERNRARLSQHLNSVLSPAICKEFLHYSQDLALELYKASQLEINYAPSQASNSPDNSASSHTTTMSSSNSREAKSQEPLQQDRDPAALRHSSSSTASSQLSDSKAKGPQQDTVQAGSVWDRFFSQSDEQTIRLRSGCPLRRVGNQYSFIHKSFYEFFLAQRLIRAAQESSTAPLIILINTRPIQAEPQVLQFLYQAKQSQAIRPAWLNTLFVIVKQSASQPTIAQASANAATILNACDENLIGQLWAGVQLPGADLSYCVLAHSDLSGANLQGAILIHTVLYQTNLKNADLRGVKWGEFPRLELKAEFRAIAWHPTKPIIAIAQDTTILQLNSESGEQIGPALTGHRWSVTSVAYRPDGRRLVSASLDKTLRQWDAESGQPIGAPLAGHTGSVKSVAFSSDGRRLASGGGDYYGSDNTVRLWDAETGKQIGAPLTGHRSYVASVAFSSDGRRLVSGSWDNTVRQWDAATGKQIGAPLTGHTNSVRSVAYRPDGRRLVSGSDDGTVRQWDAETGEQIGAPLIGHTGVVWSVAYRSDGRRLVSASLDKTLRQWDAESGQPIGAPLTGHTDMVTSVAYRSDGCRLVSGSSDKTLRQWDAATGQSIGAPLTEHTWSVTSVAYRPDGRRLVSGREDGTVHQWDAETGQSIGAPLIGHTDRVTSVAYHPDGHRLVSGSWDHTLRQWDVASGQQIGPALTGHTWSVTSVAYRPDGRHLVSGGGDNTVRQWDVASGQQIGPALTGHRSRVHSVAFSSDGRRLASGSADRTVRLWDAETGKQIGAPLTEPWSGEVTSVAYRPDGRHLVSGDGDNTVRQWDVETGKQIGAPLTGHTESVTSVTFSSDGCRIVSGSYDKTVRLWDAASGKCLAVLQWHQTIRSIALIASPLHQVQVDTAESKSLGTLPLAKANTEDWLAIGDAAGTISFWTISTEGFQLRLMHKQSAMPLLANGANLQGCRMDAMSRSLLEQHGGDVSGVVVSESKAASRMIVGVTDSKQSSASSRLLSVAGGISSTPLETKAPKHQQLAMTTEGVNPTSSSVVSPLPRVSQPVAQQSSTSAISVTTNSGAAPVRQEAKSVVVSNSTSSSLISSSSQVSNGQASTISTVPVSGEAKRTAVSHPVAGTGAADSKQGSVSSPSRPVAGGSSSAQEEIKDSKRQQPVAAAGQSVSSSSSALRFFSRLFSRTEQQPSASTTSVTTSSSSSLATSTQSTRVQDQKARNSSLQTNPLDLDEEKESSPPQTNVQDEKLRNSLPQLLPGVYVGDSAAYQCVIQQQGAGFAAAIKLTAQRHGPSTAPLPAGFQLLDLGQGLADSKGDWPTLKSRLPQAFALLDQALSQGQEVLLFCTPTLSHSLAVAQAYLIYQSGITAVEADAFVRVKLPQAQNPFLPQLKAAEKELIQLGRKKAESKEGVQQAGGVVRPRF